MHQCHETSRHLCSRVVSCLDAPVSSHVARAQPAMMHTRPRRGQGCTRHKCRPEMQTNVHLATALPGPQPKLMQSESEQCWHQRITLFSPLALQNVMVHPLFVFPKLLHEGERCITASSVLKPSNMAKSKAPIPSIERIVALPSTSVNAWTACATLTS